MPRATCKLRCNSKWQPSTWYTRSTDAPSTCMPQHTHTYTCIYRKRIRRRGRVQDFMPVHSDKRSNNCTTLMLLPALWVIRQVIKTERNVKKSTVDLLITPDQCRQNMRLYKIILLKSKSEIKTTLYCYENQSTPRYSGINNYLTPHPARLLPFLDRSFRNDRND